MSEIRRVYSQPNASSLKEGEEVVYLGSSKPLARYRKEGGQIWISYMTTNGDLFVDKDFNVQGTISQGGSGGGTGKPVVKGGLVETKAGGLGASYSAAVTMNTLTDANSVRSRLIAGLDSSGNVDRTVATDKGGLGADFSGTATGFIRIINGTAAQRSYANAKTDLSLNLVDNTSDSTKQAATLSAADKDDVGLDNVANVDTRDLDNMNAGTLVVGRGGTGGATIAAAKASLAAATTFRQSSDDPGIPDALAAGDIWIDTFANNKQYRATAAGDDAITAGEWEEVTIEAAGMDAVAGVVLFSDPVESGVLDDDTRATAASRLWVQSGTTATAKITINYYHESANESMKLACHLCTADGARAASALLGVYAVSIGAFSTGSTPNMSSAEAGPVTISTTKTDFDATIVTGALDITGLSNNVLYKVVVLLNNADASTNTLMTTPTIIVYGS
jgi:hypothetical protein